MKQIRRKKVILTSNDQNIIRHESLNKFVTGKAQYIDDLTEEYGTLHAYIGKSDFAKGEIIGIDLEKVRSSDGVVDVFTSKDIPGTNDISPTALNDEPVLVESSVSFYGQPIFVVVAKTRLQARKASFLAVIRKNIKPPIFFGMQ